MKKFMFTFFVVLAFVAVFAVAPASAEVPIEIADLSNDDLTGGGFCESFNAEQPGSWGGDFGNGAVTAWKDDPDHAGYCHFTWEADVKARRIELRVLDGLADDSFDVYVKNPAGKWVLVYSYEAHYSGEEWVIHDIYYFPAGKGQGKSINIKIIPTNVGWLGYTTYGQLAVDYIAVYED